LLALAALHRLQPKQTVLVAQSWCEMAITEAGIDPNVSALVCIAARADAGEDYTAPAAGSATPTVPLMPSVMRRCRTRVFHTSALISSAARPPIMHDAALVPGPEIMDGMTEASSDPRPPRMATRDQSRIERTRCAGVAARRVTEG
jgi:hypothetical protein